MITNNELDIFRNFRINRELPKYNRPKSKPKMDSYVSKEDGEIDEPMVSWGETPAVGFNSDGDMFVVDTNGMRWRQKPWRHKLRDYREYMRYLKAMILGKHPKPKPGMEEKIDPITIKAFFTQIQNGVKDLVSIRNIAEVYEKQIVHARKLHQQALVEILSSNLDVVRAETHLIQRGSTKYVTEKDVIEFYKKVKGGKILVNKALKLNWISNFIRPIPTDVINLMTALDNLYVFDNYVILHYDPKDRSTESTKKEKEAKRDPILFGVINHSRKLYYIADWKDEYCDLTLSDMFETLGRDGLEINNDTVKLHMHQKQ